MPWFRCGEETEAYDPKLPEVREKVEKAYRQMRAVDLARQRADETLKIVQGGADFDKALADAPTPPVETIGFTRMDPVPGLGAPLIDFTKQTLGVDVGSTGMTAYGSDPKEPHRIRHLEGRFAKEAYARRVFEGA